MFRTLVLAPPTRQKQLETLLPNAEAVFHDNIEEALNDLAQQPYEVLVFDYQFGVEAIFDFLVHPLVRGSHAGLIFLAPENDHTLGEAALEHGACVYLDMLTPLTMEQAMRIAIKTRRLYMELHEARQFYENILQDQTELVVRVDLRHGLVFANAAFCAFYGKTLDELLGTNTTDQYIHPDDLPTFQAKLAALTPQKPVFRNVNRLLIDGQIYWTEWMMRGTFDENGQLYAYQSVGRDITAPKTIQDQLQQQAELLQQIQDAVILTDADFVISAWNHGAEEMYGYSAQEAIGMNLISIFQTEIIAMSVEEALAILQDRGVWQGEARQRHANGEWVWVRSSVNMVKANEKLVGFLAINNNITKHKEAEQHQQALEAERYRARLLKSLIGDLTHDLLTPITTLKTSLYLVSKATDADRREKHLQRSDEQVEKLERILQNMMTMKRLDISTSESNLVLSRYDINQILKDVFYDFATRPQRVRWNLDEKLPRALLNPSQFALACHEILMNAFNYTPDDGQIEIRTQKVENMVMLEVRDNGIGIEAQDLPRIFDRFFRADKARNSETGGAGLGLAMAKKIVDMHGGEILVESVANQGSTFRLFIPM